jgi:histidinol-phosphate/aromatic aminotransferase/cobyric acid decarboxylase-like protein
MSKGVIFTGVAHGALDHLELASHGLRPDSLLDFSSNINPFGPPAGVWAALAALDPAPYPDRSCLQLRRALAMRHGCDIEQVLPGNGSNELIHLLARALLRPDDVALVVGPTFGEYAHASRLAHAQVVEWRACAADHFILDGAAVVDQIWRLRPRLTWLCVPNNPTGVDMKAADHRAIAEACAANDGLLVVDRTYHAFVRGCESRNDQFMPVMPHVLYLHSLTKSHALAGIRLGYLLGNVDPIACISMYQPTWSVSSAAQVAGVAALADATFLPRTLPQLWEASDALHDSLEHLGLVVWRDALPLLLVRTGDGAATRAALLARGCVVRACASFDLPEWVRVSPRGPDDNAHLVEIWKELL